MDGGGDGAMLSWGVFAGERFRILGTSRLSPAAFFTYVASLCGFSAFEEGKVMGLAAYGQSNTDLRLYFERHFGYDRRVWRWSQTFRRNGTADPVQNGLTLIRFAARRDGVAIGRRRRSRCSAISRLPPEDIARTGQDVFNDLMTQLVANVVALSGQREVACACGPLHNVVANGHLARATDPWAIHIPVAPQMLDCRLAQDCGPSTSMAARSVRLS